ncbi:MAG: restriction endonuclease [Alphaproteobacteria bacterium]
MAVPDFQTLMRPVLAVLAEGRRSSADLRAAVAARLQLADADLEAKLPSGRQTVFANRVAWANVYLQRARCVARVTRGVYEATERGRALLERQDGRIDMRTLAQFDEYRDWVAGSRRTRDAAPAADDAAADETPEERLEQLVQSIHADLEAELLDRVKRLHPREFEALVLRLLAALGYGGGKPALVQATAYAGDGGVDGVINEDALGLDTIYVQAKRYAEQKVGRPEIQAFVGTLVGLNAHKGVFVTTAGFAPSARDYVARIDKRVVLVDGRHLARLMLDHGIGVRTKATYVVQEIDENEFG